MNVYRELLAVTHALTEKLKNLDKKIVKEEQ